MRISGGSSDVVSSDLAMTAIWSAENRFSIWFEIEAHATDALAELGVVPKSAAKALWDWWATKPAIDVAAIDAIEAVTKHDVIAFLTWVAEQVGEIGRASCRERVCQYV